MVYHEELKYCKKSIKACFLVAVILLAICLTAEYYFNNQFYMKLFAGLSGLAAACGLYHVFKYYGAKYSGENIAPSDDNDKVSGEE